MSIRFVVETLPGRVATAARTASDQLAFELDASAELIKQLRIRIGREDLLSKARSERARHAETSSGHPFYSAAVAANLPPEFDLVKLEPEFVNESLERGGTVRYLTAEERKQLELIVRDGKLYNRDGKLFDTKGGLDHSAIWVMDGVGNFYGSTYRVQGEFHPSSIVAGESVAGTGTFTVLEGHVLEFGDSAGLCLSPRRQVMPGRVPYLPEQRHTMQVVEYLRSLGLGIPDDAIYLL